MPGLIPTTASRPRSLYAILLAITVALGLGSRRYGAALPDVIARYAGDALWATMVMWIYALILPRASTARLAILALATAYAVELSQLLRASWLNVARESRVGALVLGQGFLWSDLVCYAVGVGIGVMLDAPWFRKFSAGGREVD